MEVRCIEWHSLAAHKLRGVVQALTESDRRYAIENQQEYAFPNTLDVQLYRVFKHGESMC